MNRLFTVLAFTLLLTLPLLAQEKLTLTSPVSNPSTSDITLDRVELLISQNAILIAWHDNTGKKSSVVYSTPAPAANPSQPTGATLLSTLNKANFSTNSFQKAVLQRLVTDGYLPAGTVTGTPQ